MLLVVAFDGGFIGVTAVDGNLCGRSVVANNILEKPECGLFIPVLGQQKVNRLAVFVHGAIEIVPLAFNLDVGLIHPPAHPHWTLAPMERLFQGGTVFDHPALDRGVIDLYPALLHQFFDMPIAQGIRDVPTHTHQDNILGEMGPLEAHRHHRSPSLYTASDLERPYHKSPPMKICDKAAATARVRPSWASISLSKMRPASEDK